VTPWVVHESYETAIYLHLLARKVALSSGIHPAKALGMTALRVPIEEPPPPTHQSGLGLRIAWRIRQR